MPASHHRTVSPLGSLRRRWRGFVVLHRRLLVSLAVGLAVVAGLRVVSPPPPVAVDVVVAAHDLPGGRVLTSDDLDVRRVPADLPPDGATRDPAAVAGSTLAAPVRAGEVITDRRVLGEGLLAAHPGTVAVPVRIPDAEVPRLLQVGDRVDLVAASSRGSATVVADAAPVLALPRPAGGSGPAGHGGALVVLAVPEPDVLEVAGAAAAGVIGVVLLG